MLEGGVSFKYDVGGRGNGYKEGYHLNMMLEGGVMAIGKGII